MHTGRPPLLAHTPLYLVPGWETEIMGFVALPGRPMRPGHCEGRQGGLLAITFPVRTCAEASETPRALVSCLVECGV